MLAKLSHPSGEDFLATHRAGCYCHVYGLAHNTSANRRYRHYADIPGGFVDHRHIAKLVDRRDFCLACLAE